MRYEDRPGISGCWKIAGRCGSVVRKVKQTLVTIHFGVLNVSFTPCEFPAGLLEEHGGRKIC